MKNGERGRQERSTHIRNDKKEEAPKKQKKDNEEKAKRRDEIKMKCPT